MTTVVAATALAALVGTASAGNLSISSQNLRVVFSSVELGSSEFSLRCAVTLEGSFHGRTIPKVARSLVGYVTGARMRRPCTGGTAWANSGETNEVLGGTFANTLPWHLTYEGFGGTLPAISSFRILLTGSTFTGRATVLGITLLCTYTTGAAGNATGTATRNTTTGVIDNLVASGRIRSSSGGFCPEGQFASIFGDGVTTVLGASTKLTVTLI